MTQQCERKLASSSLTENKGIIWCMRACLKLNQKVLCATGFAF